MSELDELIEINKNIEKQNNEIIRLLKIIAGEKQEEAIAEEVEPVEDVSVEVCDLFDGSLDVGEAYFIDEDIFRLTVKNNETMIDNLTGNGKAHHYNVAQTIAKESIKRKQSIGDGTVILTESSQGKLPQTINLCVDQGVKRAMIPWNQTIELLGAPQELQMMIKLDLYRNEEHLIQQLFEE